MRSRLGAESEASGDYGAMLFRALLDQGGLAVGVVDAEGRLTLMSRGLREMVGSSSGSLASDDFPRLFNLYDADGNAPLKPEDVPVTRALRGETVRDAVISMRRSGEPVRHLRCNALPLPRREGESTGAVVLVTDISAERAAVSRQDMIRGLLLDTVNHELRTPLTVVLANAELITDAVADVPDHLRGPVSAIARASERLRETVQHVTDLVDLEALGRAVRSDTSICELLGTVLDRNRGHADARRIALHLECSESLSWELDPDLVRKAVHALVDNALTYGPTCSQVNVVADVRDDLLRIRVSDSGGGIPAHDQERLTKPFERGSSSESAPHRRGLGLPLAQAVATSHHGVLLLKRHQPRGFTATLVLA